MANVQKGKKNLSAKRLFSGIKGKAGAVLWFPAVLLIVLALSIPTLIRMLDERTLSISYYTIDEENIHSDVRIALISDLHFIEFGAENADLVQAIRTLKPDIITVCGDMTQNGSIDDSRVVSLCEKLLTIAPVYYAYGNHEFHDVLFEGSTIHEDLVGIGVKVLTNYYETVEVDENRIDLGGLSEDPTQYEQYGKGFIESFLQSANTRVLLTHNPGHYDRRYKYEGAGSLIGKDIDVALCAHRHGGQVIVPTVGGLYHPDVGFLPDFTHGVTEVAGTSVVVTRGLGGDGPVPRINNPPEIVLLILQ